MTSLTDVSPADLAARLLTGAKGSPRLTAAIILLAKEGTWLANRDFVEACVVPVDGAPGAVEAAIDWAAAVRNSRHDPGDGEIVTVAAWIAGYSPDGRPPQHDLIDAMSAERLALVLLALAGVNDEGAAS
jgi:hypothetical protein